jgi:mediator of RNA polymerase II transcription subunit 7
MMMEDQLERSRLETKGIMEMKKKVEGILEGLGQDDTTENITPAVDLNGAAPRDDGCEAWDELDKHFH